MPVYTATSTTTSTVTTTSTPSSSSTTDEEMEILPITKFLPPPAKSQLWIENLLKDASKMSVTNQTLVGGLSGWCFGRVVAKLGKMAAATFGTSLLLLQIAQHQGYVNVNWRKLADNACQVRKAILKEGTKEGSLPCKLSSFSQSFFEENVLLASVFAGGFLLGIS